MTLREYLKSSPFTIETFAEHLGENRHTVRKWIYGQREPSLAAAVRIGEVTGGKVAPADLIKPQVAA